MNKLQPGTKYCKCAACGRYFTNVTAFDLHRTGPGNGRSCCDPSSLTTKKGTPKLQLNARGYWARPGRPR